MEVLKYTDLTPDERELLDLYRQLDEIQQEKIKDIILKEKKTEELVKLYKSITLSDEQEKYLTDLMQFDRLPESRQKEVMEYHQQQGFTAQIIEGVKNMAI